MNRDEERKKKEAMSGGVEQAAVCLKKWQNNGGDGDGHTASQFVGLQLTVVCI